MCSLLALTEWKMSVLCSERRVTREVCSDTHLSGHTAIRNTHSRIQTHMTKEIHCDYTTKHAFRLDLCGLFIQGSLIQTGLY